MKVSVEIARSDIRRWRDCFSIKKERISKSELNHQEVQETADRVAKDFKILITKIIENI